MALTATHSLTLTTVREVVASKGHAAAFVALGPYRTSLLESVDGALADLKQDEPTSKRAWHGAQYVLWCLREILASNALAITFQSLQAYQDCMLRTLDKSLKELLPSYERTPH